MAKFEPRKRGNPYGGLYAQMKRELVRRAPHTRPHEWYKTGLPVKTTEEILEARFCSKTTEPKEAVVFAKPDGTILDVWFPPGLVGGPSLEQVREGVRAGKPVGARK